MAPTHDLVIAIVEDDDAMRKAVRRVLHTEGFATEAFPDAEHFLASGASARIACMVLDIRLPGMSGIDLYKTLRSGGSNVPTIFITAQDESRLRGVKLASSDSCLVKPFSGESLVQAVQHSVGGQAAGGTRP